DVPRPGWDSGARRDHPGMPAKQLTEPRGASRSSIRGGGGPPAARYCDNRFMATCGEQRCEGDSTDTDTDDHASPTVMAQDSGLAALVAVAGFHHIPARADDLARGLTLKGAATCDDILLAARSLGLKARIV